MTSREKAHDKKLIAYPNFLALNDLRGSKRCRRERSEVYILHDLLLCLTCPRQTGQPDPKHGNVGHIVVVEGPSVWQAHDYRCPVPAVQPRLQRPIMSRSFDAVASRHKIHEGDYTNPERARHIHGDAYKKGGSQVVVGVWTIFACFNAKKTDGVFEIIRNAHAVSLWLMPSWPRQRAGFSRPRHVGYQISAGLTGWITCDAVESTSPVTVVAESHTGPKRPSGRSRFRAGNRGAACFPQGDLTNRDAPFSFRP